MAWFSDDSYSFTISLALEGKLDIWNATITAETKTWNLVVNGVDQTPANLSIHPGSAIRVSVSGKNTSTVADNFLITFTAPDYSATCVPFSLASGIVSGTYNFDFTMPTSSAACKIETFHEE